MNIALGAVTVIAVLIASLSQAVAQGGARTDPDWPCRQIKAPTFSLAAVWSGPELDLTSQSWRAESDVADLAMKMMQRRVPVAEVETAIADFKAKAGADADSKLLRAFSAAFQDLAQQRSQVLDGLERFGRKQREMADRIREESESGAKSRAKRIMRKGRQTPPAKSEWNGTSAFLMIAGELFRTYAKRRR